MRDLFQNRHIGISEEDRLSMLNAIGVNTLDQLISQTIPADIRLSESLNLPEAMTEAQFLRHISELGSRNELFHSLIGTGWYNTLTPSVILRNIFENASWYTSYTPYQAEISQGRLEALLNFQTAVTEFTGLPVANASLLDEATAAAEAATMMYNLRSRDQVKAGVNKLFVDEATFPQTLAVLRTRTKAQGINLVIGNYESFSFGDSFFGAIVQFPNANGEICDYREFVSAASAKGIKVAVAADILSLALLTPPGEWGVDIVLGSTQRWGIPVNFGGPSAAYFACKEA